MNEKFKERRKEYRKASFNLEDVHRDPYKQFMVWMDKAIKSDIYEPNAMSLSTCGKNMQPSTRMVLLKELKKDGFIFFTNYNSKKGKQLKENPYGSILFYWPELELQIRIDGRIEQTTDEVSDEFYLSRTGKSRIGAWASPQSEEIPDKEYLEQLHADYELQFIGQFPKRPKYWGGYMLIPYIFEFWQGRPNRLHDRIEYYLDDNEWKLRRLAP